VGGLLGIRSFHRRCTACEAEFGDYLFLIVLFPTIVIPASLLGLFMTLGSILFSGWVGDQVDKRTRFGFSRRMIVAPKGERPGAAAYAA
jgi:hypothetical protein